MRTMKDHYVLVHHTSLAVTLDMLTFPSTTSSNKANLPSLFQANAETIKKVLTS